MALLLRKPKHFRYHSSTGVHVTTYCRRLIGRKGLKFSSPSACSAVSREAAKSLLEEDADASLDMQKVAFPSEPLLYRDSVLDD